MPEEPARPEYYAYENEIDLREYVEILLRYWPWIVGCALVAAVTAFGITAMRPPTYEAQAGVAIVGIRMDVEFEPRIDTVTGADGNLSARRQALVALVSSNEVARSVLDEVGEQLEPEERFVDGLMGRVETSSEGDLIKIKASHGTPRTAAAIANAWAKAYVQYVNSLYNVMAESEEAIVAQLADTRLVYTEAQRALEGFVADNRVEELKRKIGSKQQLLDVYQEEQDAAYTEPVQLELGSRRHVLADYYEDLQEIEMWLADARALRAQVGVTSGSAAANVGNALALIGLRSRALGGQESLAQLQVNLAGDGIDEVQPADVDALIEVLESRRERTREQIQVLAADLFEEEPQSVALASDDALGEKIAALNGEILALEAELEAQEAQERELRKRRDNAWETYQALAQKQAEVNVQSQLPGVHVRMAASAEPPRRPTAPSKKKNAVLAGVVGMMLGVFGAFVVEWWRGYEADRNPGQA